MGPFDKVGTQSKTGEAGMRVTVCHEPKKVHALLLKLLAGCERFSWASAWATPNQVVAAALEAKDKMSHLVIGTKNYITSPEVLDECLSLKNVRVYPPDQPGLFHPKVYAFELKDHLEVYIGSSNLTGAGLSRNTECGVFLSGDKSDPQLQELLKYVRKCWLDGSLLKPDFIASYKANKKRVKEAEEALKKFTRIKPKISTNSTATKLGGLEMDWDQYVTQVRKFKNQKVGQRLAMLSATRALAARRFDSLSFVDRKKVSGRLSGVQADGIDYGWFGQMLANGKFGIAIDKYAPQIADALLEIPKSAKVERRHYDAFMETFVRIPNVTNGWLGLGTRLLAMRRPDQFVCLDGPNIQGVSAAFGAPYSRVKLDNYWDFIIEQIRLAPWYLADEPIDDEERGIWLGRVAFLDAIYYNPKHR